MYKSLAVLALVPFVLGQEVERAGPKVLAGAPGKCFSGSNPLRNTNLHSKGEETKEGILGFREGFTRGLSNAHDVGQALLGLRFSGILAWA